MGIAERLTALGRDERREQWLKCPTTGQRRTEVLALDALHRDEDLVVDPSEIEDWDNILMGQAHR